MKKSGRMVTALLCTALMAAAAGCSPAEFCKVPVPKGVLSPLIPKNGSGSFFKRATDRVTVREAQRARPPGS